jgi:O-antigen ligase
LLAHARPRAELLGLAAIIATLPFHQWRLGGDGLAVSPTEAALLVVLAWRAAAALVRQNIRVPSTGYEGPLILVLAGALGSLLVTQYLRLSLRELRTLIVEPIAFFVVARATLRSTEDAWFITRTLVVVTSLTALLALLAWMVGTRITDADGWHRALGPYSSPNHLALAMGRVIPFAAALAVVPAARFGALLACISLAIALAISFSMGGWLGALLGSGVAIVLSLGRLSRRVAISAIACIVVGAVAVLSIPPVRQRLDPSQATRAVRVQLWQASATMLQESPLLGIGMDNFLYRYPTFLPSGAVLEPNLSHPHNLVLHVWLQLGVLGLVGGAWTVARFTQQLRSALARPEARSRALAAGAAGSMTDFLIHGLVDNSYFLADMALIFWLTVAIGAALSYRGSPRG